MIQSLPGWILEQPGFAIRREGSSPPALDPPVGSVPQRGVGRISWVSDCAPLGEIVINLLKSSKLAARVPGCTFYAEEFA